MWSVQFNNIHTYRDGNVSIHLCKSDIGELKSVGDFIIVVDGVSRKVRFSTLDPNYHVDLSQRITAFNDFASTVAKFPTEFQIKFIKFLEKHSPSSQQPYDFHVIRSKIQNLYACAFEGEKNIKIEPKILNAADLDRIHSAVNAKAIDEPSKPFQLILNIIKDDSLLRDAMINVLAALEEQKHKPCVRNELITSCTNTSALLASLFFGRERFLQIQTVMYRKYSSGRGLLDLCFRPTLKFVGVLRGEIVTEIRKECPEMHFSEDHNAVVPTLNQKYSQYEVELTSYVKEYIATKPDVPLLSLMSFRERVEIFNQAVCSYPFNQKNLQYLIEEVNENFSKTSSEKSFCYYILLKCPTGYTDHALFVEQYLQDDATCHRIYQSWIGQGTLLEDLQKGGGILGNESGLSLAGVVEYLQRIQVFLTYTGEDREEALSSIFGYKWGYAPQVADMFGDEVSGCDLVYWCEAINPGDCWNNFVELMSTQ